MIYRDIVVAVECPINVLIRVDDCGRCPYNGKYSSKKSKMGCEYETETEKKMKAEPSKIKEPKSRW
jgi:hypothetical protein